MTSAEHQKAAEHFKTLVRSLNKGSRHIFAEHLTNLQSDEIERLRRHHEPHKIHRAQGAVEVLQTLLSTLEG